MIHTAGSGPVATTAGNRPPLDRRLATLVCYTKIYIHAEILSRRMREAALPPTARRYGGEVVVRVPPEVHRRLALEAAGQDITLNRLVSARLSS